MCIYRRYSVRSGVNTINFSRLNPIFCIKKMPGLAPFRGGMKFAQQISPLLNYYTITEKVQLQDFFMTRLHFVFAILVLDQPPFFRCFQTANMYC